MYHTFFSRQNIHAADARLEPRLFSIMFQVAIDRYFVTGSGLN